MSRRDLGDPLRVTGDTVRLRVVRHPVTAALDVYVNGKIAYSRFGPPPLQDFQPTSAFRIDTSRGPGVPTCTKLAGRLRDGE